MVAEIKFGAINVDKLVCVGHEKEYMEVENDKGTGQPKKDEKGKPIMRRNPPSIRLLFSEGIREHVVYATDKEMERDLKVIIGMTQGMIPLKFMSVKLSSLVMVGKAPTTNRMVVYFDKTHETVSYNLEQELEEDYGRLVGAFKSSDSILSLE